MTNDNTHTADEITAAADELLAWAKEHGGVLAVAVAPLLTVRRLRRCITTPGRAGAWQQCVGAARRQFRGAGHLG